MHFQPDKIPDPRGTLSWPLTPEHIELYEHKHIKHTLDDRYGLQDNCYFESVVPIPFKDKNLQGDAGELEFQTIIERKSVGLLSKTATGHTVNEKLQYSKGKRRGRKNAYYDKIDQEDDEEVDAIEEGIQT